MSDTDFSDLVNEAEQLATEIEGTGELPKIERSLRQVLEASQALWSRVSVSGAQDIQANLLLGTKGLDLPQIIQKLQSLSAQKAFEPLDPVPLTDIPTFLRNESENAVLQLIEATHHSTFKHVEDLRKTKSFQDWKTHKTNLMNSLLGYSKQIVDVPHRAERSMLHESLSGMPSSIDQKEMAYARCLKEFHSPSDPSTQQNSLLNMFALAANTLNNQKLSEMWKMLKCMTEIPPMAKDDPLKARASVQIQDKLINQALSYLEQRYKSYMQSVVSSNLNAAKRGGIPGTYSLVRGFVSVHVTQVSRLEDVMIDGLHMWPLVYYCLRCGDIPAALHCVKLAGVGQEEMLATLEDLKEGPSRRLTMQMEMQIKSTYRRLVRTSNDPYKRAVYCVLGACDVHDDHKEVAVTADDFLWLKLSQVRQEEKEAVPDRLHYSLLQSLVLQQYGESHYKAWEQPHIYFQVLTLTGQWEAALDFLVHSDKYAVDAVHMALALHQLNFLALPATSNSPLLVIDESDKPPLRRLNLLRLVLLHTQKFEMTDPKETLHYYYCLRDLTSNDGKNAFVSCVTNLVLESKLYDVILGTLLEDGCRQPGLIDQFQSSQISVKAIIENVAECTEQKGLYEDAVKLYDLCGVHEKVLSLMNMLVGQVVSKRCTGGSTQRARLARTAASICSRYDGSRLTCAPSTLTTFYLLLDLMEFFDLYHTKQHAVALEVMHKTRILPQSSTEMDEKVSNFKLLDETVCRNIPEILLAVMNIYHQQYIQAQGDIATNKLEDPLNSKKLSYLREQARLITTFTGTIPYRMPSGTNSKLVQLEILMN